MEPFIITHSKIRFNYLTATPKDICLEDIAHALSQICRFTGHTSQHYCVSPYMRILKADLTWKCAGDLAINDILIGFDEKATGEHFSRKKKKIRPARISSIGIIKRPVYDLTLSDGTVLRSSSEHPWLVASKVSRNQKWETTENIFRMFMGSYQTSRRSWKCKRYIVRFYSPWEEVYTKEIGYLSGILDGEGHLCMPHVNNGGLTLGFEQNPGIVLEYTKSILDKYNIKYTCRQDKNFKINHIDLLGQWATKLRVLGIIRPPRLINHAINSIISGSFGAELEGGDLLEIVNVEYKGEQDVVGMETSTHTYICEGFGAHNSVAQHSVLVSKYVKPENALWGLLHDAPEAYLNDLSSPLKTVINGNYGALEYTIMNLVLNRFGLEGSMPKDVKYYDRVLGINELWTFVDPSYKEDGIIKLNDKIIPWNSKRAKWEFITRFQELTC